MTSPIGVAGKSIRIIGSAEFSDSAGSIKPDILGAENTEDSIVTDVKNKIAAV